MSQLEKLEQLAISLHCDVRNQEPMRKHTTFKIGGPADLFIVVNDVQSAAICLYSCKGIGRTLYGNWKRFQFACKGQRYQRCCDTVGRYIFDITLKENNVLEAGAGASLATVCGYALQQSLTGVEFAWGIPGSIGGAAFMNAGAYGEEMKDVVLSCII